MILDCESGLFLVADLVAVYLRGSSRGSGLRPIKESAGKPAGARALRPIKERKKQRKKRTIYYKQIQIQRGIPYRYPNGIPYGIPYGKGYGTP